MIHVFVNREIYINLNKFNYVLISYIAYGSKYARADCSGFPEAQGNFKRKRHFS